MKIQDRRNRGFTLMELLAVIAVISILAALLFPLSKKLIGSANQARCQGNLRALGAALHIYTSDHQGGFPMAAQTYDGYWYDLLAPYLDDGNNPTLPSLRASVPKWLVCPSKPGLVGYGWNQTYFGNHAYLVSGVVSADDTAFAKIMQVTDPSHTIILGDSKDADDQLANDYQNRYIYSTPSQSALWATRHNGGGNYFFCDGHVERLSVADLSKLAPAIFEKVKQ